MNCLGKVKPDKSGQIELIEAINLYLNEGNELVKYSLKENVYDCGDKLQYLFANIDFALKDPSLKSELNKFLKSRLS